MTETRQLEDLLAGGNGGSVTLRRKQAQELAQKLRARGGGAGLTRLEQLLASPGDVEVDRAEARTLLEELRASGRRWVFGSNEPHERSALKPPSAEAVAEPEPEPERPAEPAPERQRGFWRRFLGGRGE
jgi:hypothetical protein